MRWNSDDAMKLKVDLLKFGSERSHRDELAERFSEASANGVDDASIAQLSNTLTLQSIYVDGLADGLAPRIAELPGIDESADEVRDYLLDGHDGAYNEAVDELVDDAGMDGPEEEAGAERGLW